MKKLIKFYALTATFMFTAGLLGWTAQHFIPITAMAYLAVVVFSLGFTLFAASKL